VFGFVDIRPDLELFIPNSNDLKAKTIWQRLSDAGRRVVALSVPMTYPAPRVNGVLVSGFLAPRLDERAVSSPDVLEKLRWTLYEIDVDPAIAHESLDRFQEELLRVSTRRQETALRLMESEEWDLFFLHVMDTDRLGHFLWKFQHDPQSPRGRFFLEFCSRMDALVGQMASRLPKGAELLVMSDHGFCDLKWEVQLNRWLRAEGYLDWEGDGTDPMHPFRAVKRGSRALALVPGRIYLLTRFRCEIGTVSDIDYEPLRDEIIHKLAELKDPQTGEKVCRSVMRREEAFQGPYAHMGPDIIIDPNDGYDLKAKLGDGELFERGVLNGMHTYHDAMLLTSKGLAEVAQAEDVPQVGARLARHLLP